MLEMGKFPTSQERISYTEVQGKECFNKALENTRESVVFIHLIGRYGMKDPIVEVISNRYFQLIFPADYSAFIF
jgi:hypothetical protein